MDKDLDKDFVGEVYETKQGVFCVDPRDQFVARQLIGNGEFGQAQLRQLSYFCDKNTSVLLLGAHIGSIAIPLSKTVKNMTIFEANPQTYRLLTTNLKLNGCVNVESFNFAANDKNDVIKFVLNTVNSGGSKRLPLHHDEAYFSDDPEVAEIPAVSLDHFLHGKSYDLIFMDIEGSEYYAIKGMPRLMSEAKVVFAEFLPHHISRVAGITIEQFAACFEGFKTLIVPTLSAVFYKDDIKKTLFSMFESNQADEGLTFIRDEVNIQFG